MWLKRYIPIISCVIAVGILISGCTSEEAAPENNPPPTTAPVMKGESKAEEPAPGTTPPPAPAVPTQAPPAPPAPAVEPPKEESKAEEKKEEIRGVAREQATKTLETSNIAYNTPETIQLDDTAVVQLKLSPSFSVDELKKSITEPGKKEGQSIPFPLISRRVEAHLTGSAFKIVAIGAELPRVIKPGRVCEWSWEVTPTQPGTQRLFLTIDAMVAIDGKDVAEYEKVFAKTIKVKVTLGQRVASFVGTNWQWLWTVGLVPLGGWLFARFRSRARKSPYPHDRSTK